MSFESVRLFFACDRTYFPLLGVTLTSIKQHRNPERVYDICILHTELSENDMASLTQAMAEERFTISFRNVSCEIGRFLHRLHTRDYYSNETYYRVLIPSLFPQVKKALYLDSDIIVQEDIGKLFDADISDHLAGAVPDRFVNTVPVLIRYAEEHLGLPTVKTYFNAGVLLMNLDAMRKIHFEDLFLALLEAVTFRVAQDQDYLNVICNGRCVMLPMHWNHMPFSYAEQMPSLVHFNIDNKPWHKDDVPYGELFWQYADASPYASEVRAIRAAYSEEDRRIAKEQTEALLALADREGRDAEENARTASRIALVMQEGALSV